MPKTAKGLTYEQHQELANKLYVVRDALFSMMPEVNSYLLKDPVRKSWSRMMHDIDVLRSDFENRFCAEHHERFTPRVYYQNRIKRGQSTTAPNPVAAAAEQSSQ